MLCLQNSSLICITGSLFINVTVETETQAGSLRCAFVCCKVAREYREEHLDTRVNPHMNHGRSRLFQVCCQYCHNMLIRTTHRTPRGNSAPCKSVLNMTELYETPKTTEECFLECLCTEDKTYRNSFPIGYSRIYTNTSVRM